MSTLASSWAAVKVGFTGTFFRPGVPPQLGKFFVCRILEIRGDKLFVELENGSQGEIQAIEFTPHYFAGQGAAAPTSPRKAAEELEAR